MTEYNFKSECNNVEIDVACSALSKRRQKSGKFWTSNLGVYLILAAIMALSTGLYFLTGGGGQGTVLAVVCLIVCYVAWSYIATGNSQGSLAQSMTRAGPAQIRFSSDGFYIVHPGYESFTRWSHIEDVIAAPEGLLLLYSDYEYYPVESGAFTNFEQMESVAAQVKKWILAAKEQHAKSPWT